MSPEELTEAGEALYGERWQTDITRALGLSDSARIRQMLAGRRPIPPGFSLELTRLLRDRARIALALADRLEEGGTPNLGLLVAELDRDYPLAQVAAWFAGSRFDHVVIRRNEDGSLLKVFPVAEKWQCAAHEISLHRHFVEDYTDPDDSWGDLADAINHAAD